MSGQSRSKSSSSQQKRQRREGHAKLRQKTTSGDRVTIEQSEHSRDNKSGGSKEQFPSTRGLVSRPVRFA